MNFVAKREKGIITQYAEMTLDSFTLNNLSWDRSPFSIITTFRCGISAEEYNIPKYYSANPINLKPVELFISSKK